MFRTWSATASCTIPSATITTKMATSTNSTRTLPSSSVLLAPRDTFDGGREQISERRPRHRPNHRNQACRHEGDEHPARHISPVLTYVARRNGRPLTQDFSELLHCFPPSVMG